MCEESQDRKETYKFTSADKCESDEGCTTHELGIVEITLDVPVSKVSKQKPRDSSPEYASVFQMGREIFCKEISVEPSWTYELGKHFPTEPKCVPKTPRTSYDSMAAQM
jgi:hypothetical protein